MVSASVISNAHVPPEGVDRHGSKNDVRVVSLMVMADPGPDQSPGGLPGGVGTDSSNFLSSSSYIFIALLVCLIQYTYPILVCSKGFLEPT